MNRAATSKYLFSDITEAEAHEREVQRLTQFDDARRITEGSSMDRISINPYPDQQLSAVLTRPHLLTTLKWTSLMSSNEVLCAYRFPEALLTLPNIQTHLKGFEYFRAKVRISFRVNSTVFHYGLLQVAWLPAHDPCAPQGGAPGTMVYAPLRNVFASTNSYHTVLSAAARSTVEIDIPWVYCKEYVHLYTPEELRGSIGSVVVRVLCPLRLQGESNADVGVSVFAQFVDPEPAGMTIKEPPVWPTVANQGPGVVTQSSDPISEEERATQQGPLSSVLARTSKYVVGVRKMANSIIDGGLSALGGLEAIFRNVGLSAPADMRPASQFVPLAFKNTSVSNSVDSAARLTLNLDQKISESDRYSGDDQLGIFANWCKHWWLIDLFSFNGTMPSATPVFMFAVGPNVTPPAIGTIGYKSYDYTHFNWYANLCTYWRGSMKYRLRFAASKFATCRVAIVWFPDVLGSYSADRPIQGDAVTRIVDICGDTEVEFVIPYLQSEPWKPVGVPSHFPGAEHVNGYVGVYIVNPISTSAGDDILASTVMGTLEAAPCADIQLAVPCGLSTNCTIQVQSGDGLGPSIQSTFDEGACFGDPVTSVAQLSHRYYWAGLTPIYDLDVMTESEAFEAVASDPVNKPPGQANFLTLLMLPWGYHRGSVRVLLHGTETSVLRVNLFVKKNPTGAVLAAKAPFHAICNAGVELQTKARGGAMQVEVPYYNSLYASTLNATYNGMQAPDMDRRFTLSCWDNTRDWDMFVSNGDNYSFGIPIAPPRIYVMDPAA